MVIVSDYFLAGNVHRIKKSDRMENIIAALQNQEAEEREQSKMATGRR
jgi:hypothetical protein